MNSNKVLLILTDGFEEIEAFGTFAISCSILAFTSFNALLLYSSVINKYSLLEYPSVASTYLPLSIRTDIFIGNTVWHDADIRISEYSGPKSIFIKAFISSGDG